MSQLFYTEQRLNEELEVPIPLEDYNTNTFQMPLDYRRRHHLPSTVGANALPPQGPFSTQLDVSLGDDDADNDDDGGKKGKPPPAQPLVTPFVIAVAALVAYLFFFPR